MVGGTSILPLAVSAQVGKIMNTNVMFRAPVIGAVDEEQF